MLECSHRDEVESTSLLRSPSTRKAEGQVRLAVVGARVFSVILFFFLILIEEDGTEGTDGLLVE